MTLRELLGAVGLPRAAAEEGPTIRGVCLDSRRVREGDLFAAVVGERFDGRRFARQAVERGAAAVFGPAPESDSDAAESLGVPWIECAEPRRYLAGLAAEAYGHPARRLRTVGVTGTNGKSSVTTLLGHVLEAAGEPAGTLGTVGYSFRDRVFESAGRTTPEAPDVHRMLSEMRRLGAEAAVLEVSSHALELGRVDGVSYRLALFTNLSRDHLDFHGDMESYFAAKKRLFDRLEPGGRAVVSVGGGDDPWAERLARELRQRGIPLLTCSRGAGGDEADVRPRSARVGLDGIEAVLETPRGEMRVRSGLIGRFHLENLLTAAAGGLALGLDPETVARGLARAETVPGRLERVPGDAVALVDFAHTPAALKAALGALREITDRPILAVFGCGGERDRGKRPQMGRVVGQLADLAILTSDNPRREDPQRILAEAEAGLIEAGSESYLIEPDRRLAIHRAVELARADGSVVLVAGKGHETTQDLGDRVIPFDDRLELAAALAASKAGRREEAHCG